MRLGADREKKWQAASVNPGERRERAAQRRSDGVLPSVVQRVAGDASADLPDRRVLCRGVCGDADTAPGRLAGAVSPAVAGGSAYPAGVAAGTVLAATNGEIHVNSATANGDPDDGGQLPAATTGDVHVGNGS